MARTSEVGQDALSRDAAARRRERRHGLQRVGGPGGCAVSDVRTSSCRAAGLGGDRHVADARRDAHGLPRLSAPDVDLGLCSRDRRRCCSRCSSSARNGTQRWISLGFVSLQPSELAKLAVILFTAALLERRMHRVNDVSFALVPIGLVTVHPGRADSERARLRHRRGPRRHRDDDAVRGGPELPLPRRRLRSCCFRRRCSSC